MAVAINFVRSFLSSLLDQRLCLSSEDQSVKYTDLTIKVGVIQVKYQPELQSDIRNSKNLAVVNVIH